MIAAVDPETGEDSGNLSLSTGTLDVTNLLDDADSSQTNVGVSVSINDLFEEGVSGSDLPSLNAGHSSSDFEQTTHGAIGEGEIEVRDDPDFDPDTINRDIENTHKSSRMRRSLPTMSVASAQLLAICWRAAILKNRRISAPFYLIEFIRKFWSG